MSLAELSWSVLYARFVVFSTCNDVRYGDAVDEIVSRRLVWAFPIGTRRWRFRESLIDEEGRLHFHTRRRMAFSTKESQFLASNTLDQLIDCTRLNPRGNDF